MIVMELCTGGDLYARIPYTEHAAAHVTKQILSAVAYMHDHNVLHRDLKFENVVFESAHPEAPIKVIDFGLSKASYSPDGVTIHGERVGTLYSMAPETIKGSYDKKADAWSVGVCAFMLLAGGEKPFEGKTAKEIVVKVLSGAFEFEPSVWDGVSDLAKTFVSDLLVVDQTHRPSVSQARHHPWIIDFIKRGSQEANLDEGLKQRVHDCIIKYSFTGSFRKLALNVIAKRSAPEEIFQLRKVFDSFDTLDTGTVRFGLALAASDGICTHDIICTDHAGGVQRSPFGAVGFYRRRNGKNIQILGCQQKQCNQLH
jgi:calcium-dependent protein kinase